MVKNERGGNKHKKSKNSIGPIKIPIVEEHSAEEQSLLDYALVEKNHGGCCFELKTRNGMTKGYVRGSLSKKMWVNVGDTVLIGLREYQESKVDILFKYPIGEKKLKASSKYQSFLNDITMPEPEDSIDIVFGRTTQPSVVSNEPNDISYFVDTI